MLPRATLPVEVEENIIDQLDHDFASLRNCALTCRAWLPRSRSLLLCALRIATRSASDAVLDFFRARADMRPFVKSLATAPAPTERTWLLGTYPALLVGMLPNLRRWQIRAPVDAKIGPSPIFFHPTTLTRLRCSPITELHVSSLQFTSHSDFIRLVSSIPHLCVLECMDIHFSRRKAKSSTGGSPYPRRLLRLTTLQICQEKELDEDLLPCLLELTASSLQNLVLRPNASFKWPAVSPVMSQLRSLSLYMHQQPGDDMSTLFTRTFRTAVKCIRSLGCVFDRLEIHIHMSDNPNYCPDRTACNGPISLSRFLLGDLAQNHCQALERLLPANCMACLTIRLHIPSHWTRREVLLRTLREDSFPGLDKKERLEVGYSGGTARLYASDLACLKETSSPGNACQSYTPHNGPVSALVASPDGRLIVSGSRDVAIIWDACTRRPLHEWINPSAHPPSTQSLAFSPESNRIAFCAYTEGKPLVQIRDVVNGNKITVLQGHDFNDVGASSPPQLVCAWFPDRLILVSLTHFRVIVHTWDAHTFAPQPTRDYATPFEHGSLLLSPDGRRLAGIAVMAATSRCLGDDNLKRPAPRPRPRPRPTRRPRPRPMSRACPPALNRPLCMLWDLDTGGPGEVLLNGRPCEQVLAASFDCRSARLALVLADHSVRVWDTSATTAPRLLSVAEPTFLGERRHWNVNSQASLPGTVAFTPDGRHLLSVRQVCGFAGRMETSLSAWDALSGRLLLRCGDVLPPEMCGNVGLACFSPIGVHVALAADYGRVHVVDLAGGLSRTFGGLQEHTQPQLGVRSCRHDVATRMVFSPDGYTLCWATRGGEVEIRSLSESVDYSACMAKSPS